MERSADNRIRTTEWEDVQYRYGNRVGKYQTHEVEILAQQLGDMHEDDALKAYDPDEERVAAKMERGGYEMVDSKKEGVAAVADSDDEDDALAAIRRKRLQELQQRQANERFGTLRHVAGSDYVKEVTEASVQNWVVAVLIKPGNSECEALLTVMRSVAQRQREVKFVSMVSVEAIPTFPDRHLPCVLMYHDKILKNQITLLDPWKDRKELNVATVERALQRCGVLKRDESDED